MNEGISIPEEKIQEPSEKRGSLDSTKEYFEDLNETFMGNLDDDQGLVSSPSSTLNSAKQEQQQSVQIDEFSSDSLSREQLLNEQGKDPELISIINAALGEEDAKKRPGLFLSKRGHINEKVETSRCSRK